MPTKISAGVGYYPRFLTFYYYGPFACKIAIIFPYTLVWLVCLSYNTVTAINKAGLTNPCANIK